MGKAVGVEDSLWNSTQNISPIRWKRFENDSFVKIKELLDFRARWRFGNALQWRRSEHDVVSNQQPHDCLLNRLFRCRSKKTSNLRVTGLCEGNSPVTGEFPAQMASNAENGSIWWRHHGLRFRNSGKLAPFKFVQSVINQQRTTYCIQSGLGDVMKLP